MKIAIDAHMVGHQATGNETYTLNLIDALARLDGAGREYTVYVDRRGLSSLPPSLNGRVRVRVLPLHSPLVRIPFLLPVELWRRRADVAHMHYILPPVVPRCATVLTVHDISFERYPDFFSRSELLRARTLVPFSARRADVVIAVSEFTKADLVSFYGIDPEKIVVTSAAPAPHFHPLDDRRRIDAVRREYGIDGPFILYVGNIQPRKNLRRLIEAFAATACESDIPHRLVIVGKKAWLHSPVLEAARASRLSERITFTGYVPDKDLPALYNAADLFVYPSIFEGFGLPVLEAMSCGTPVITSNTSSLPEVGGDAAVYFDPLDAGDIARAIRAALADPELRSRLSARGLARAKEFSWAATARKTVEAYEQAFRARFGASKAATAIAEHKTVISGRSQRS
ncbi:MAG: glycosyltransferase family 1 protein [Dehalococcoidia bacterium]|nr:glycosyltransferase family 1 protein [Dehalococcoidia bacterium]